MTDIQSEPVGNGMFPLLGRVCALSLFTLAFAFPSDVVAQYNTVDFTGK